MKNKRILKNITGIVVAMAISIGIYQVAYSMTYSTPLFSTSSDSGVISHILSTVTNQPTLSADTAIEFDAQGITLDVLATYNGKNGQPAYVAYEGTVYDVSAIANWKSGSHHGVKAGTDITDIFSSSPHSKSILSIAIVVGKLAQ